MWLAIASLLACKVTPGPSAEATQRLGQIRHLAAWNQYWHATPVPAILQGNQRLTLYWDEGRIAACPVTAGNCVTYERFWSFTEVWKSNGQPPPFCDGSVFVRQIAPDSTPPPPPRAVTAAEAARFFSSKNRITCGDKRPGQGTYTVAQHTSEDPHVYILIECRPRGGAPHHAVHVWEKNPSGTGWYLRIAGHLPGETTYPPLIRGAALFTRTFDY